MSHPKSTDTSYTDLPPDYSPPGYTANNPESPDRSHTPTAQADGPGVLPPPAYAETYGAIEITEGGMDTQARIADDGRVNIVINEKTRRISSLLTPALRSQWKAASKEPAAATSTTYEVPDFAKDTPPLNILIQIIGSRGDVQPFIALGKVLREKYNHRVRVATHPTFKSFVEDNGLEFFSLSGDPSELMAFMVKNPGLIPGKESLRAGDVAKRRKGMWEMIIGGWRACIEPGDGMSYQPAIERGARGPPGIPFVADAIIANPPSFGHIHCAERLGIPLHIMFTMPWSPTAAFPHPLANIQSSNVESSLTNYISYAIVDMMTWQGLGDLVNKFREGTLGLDAVSTMWAPGMISRLKVPHTYCWSPTLIPKPGDWGSQIKVSGFYFLNLASSYSPPADLERFLNSGPPPVYIGFGSIVVSDPNGLTKKILDAVRLAGCRALVSKGWGGVGAGDLNIPDDVLLLGNCPHDWLFPRCSAVVHHGGAGTTAAGISCGKATVIVPFFGDQPFWGAMVAKAGAGPDPIPHSQLTSQNLAAAIVKAMSREVQAKAEVMGDSIRNETGGDNGAKSFLASVEEMGLGRCDLLKDRVAVWNVRGSDIKLSALAATALVQANRMEGGYGGLRLYRHKEWEVAMAPLDPITGGAGALLGTIGGIAMGAGDIPMDLFKGLKKNKGKGVESPAGASGSTSPPMHDGKSTDSIASTMAESTLSRTATGASATSSNAPAEGTVSPKFDLDFGMVMDAGKGMRDIISAGFKSPMDLTLGVSQGFRNAPKLYGDTVRPEGRVTGFQSGIKTAGKEFTLGFYDGITGLVTQPIKGAKEEGAAGAIKGFGKGLSGLVLKSGAGAWGIPAYTMKGIHREIQKLGTKDLNGYIESARAAQGLHELTQLSLETRGLIVERWNQLRSESSGKKRAASWTRVRSPAAQDYKKKFQQVDLHQYPKDKKVNDDEEEELNRAIRASLAATQPGPSYTNRGSLDVNERSRDPQDYSHKGYNEDEAMRRAIQPDYSHKGYNEDEAMRRAIQPDYSHKGYNEDEAMRRAIESSLNNSQTLHESERDLELEEAVRMSLLDSPPRPTSSFESPPPRPDILPRAASTGLQSDDELYRRFDSLMGYSGAGGPPPPPDYSRPPPGYSYPLPKTVPTEKEEEEYDDVLDDIDLHHAMEESRRHIQQKGKDPSQYDEEDDAELARAVVESLRLDDEKRRRQEEEERLVMEYVARQSHEEEDLRRKNGN